MPALRAIHPGAMDNVLAVAEVLRGEADVLDALVDGVVGSGPSVSLTRLRELAPALRRLVVQRLADAAAGRFAPGVARRADEIAGLSERGTSRLDVGQGLRAVAEYGALRFDAAGDGAEPGVPVPVALPVPGSAAFGDIEVRCELASPSPEPGVLDRATLDSSLIVRSWRSGDRMAPLGLGGTKSLQDLFVSRRVPRAQRARLPVVVSGGEIVWIPGVATSERCKVTERTHEAVRLLARAENHGAR
jgi:tRNA(Ile)-lysidine synthase